MWKIITKVEDLVLADRLVKVSVITNEAKEAESSAF